MGLSRTILAEHSAVASEQSLASMAGYNVLKRGGNAFDAAAATSFVLAVTLHPAGGIGGDFFGMFFEARTGKVHCLNSSGWAPSGLDLHLVMTISGGIPTFGPLTCMVPGFVAGVWAMHRKFGAVPFDKLMKPAIGYAAKGFPAGEGLCRSIAGAFDSLSSEAREVFAPDGRPPVVGEWIRQKALGRVLEEISSEGPDAFYRGWPAEKITSTLNRNGVPARKADFIFKPEWVNPLTLDYRGTTIYEAPPNSMGATCLLMLKVLSTRKMSDVGPLSRERIERTMNAAELAYERKSRMLGDPRFTNIDLRGFMKIGPRRVKIPGRLADGDTTAFSVADGDGNLVSGIQSLFNHFGSRVFVPEAGIMLNNRGAGFAMAGPNKVEPGKRPLHTLSSLILETEGKPLVGIGTSGGEQRPLQHTLFVTNLVDFEMPLEKAVEHPRFLWNGGRSMVVEDGYEVLRSGSFDAQKLPHPGRTGVCQAVEVSDHLRKAVCDVRGDGVPAGF